MTMKRLRGGLLALGLLLAACGGGAGGGSGGGEADKTADQILADAVSAIKSASSFHISGHATGSSSNGFSLDADVASAGVAQGKIGEGSALASFVTLDGKFYIQGRDFWNAVAGPQAADAVGDKWVLLPSGSDTQSFQQFVNAGIIATCLSVDHGTLSKAGTATVNGKAAVVIADKGDKPGTAPGKLYVAADSPHYPLRIDFLGATSPGTPPGGGQCGSASSSGGSSTSSGGGEGTLTLSDFNAKSVTVTAPPNPIDLQSLLSGGG